ncbi:hypothetical protein ADL21_11355 [Streptomyces albus subsp. albus]|nr:hypothetical protein ADL21_11355 [Streptomyces albus subsp. albus]
MARIRSIKPEFFTSLTIAGLPLTARLTFIGLWTYVDDNGVGVDEPRLVRAAVWPLDDRTAAEVDADLEALRDASLVIRYEYDGRRYLAVRNFAEHQKVSHPRRPRYPQPPHRDAACPPPPARTVPDAPSSGAAPEDVPRAPEDLPETPQPLRPEQGTGSKDQGAGTRGTLRTAREEPVWSRADHEAVGERMVSAWWQRYGHRSAQRSRSVLEAVENALHNGLDPGELWSALMRLGETSKPVTGGTLQFALAALRTPAVLAGSVVPLRDSTPLEGTDARVAAWMALPIEEGT